MLYHYKITTVDGNSDYVDTHYYEGDILGLLNIEKLVLYFNCEGMLITKIENDEEVSKHENDINFQTGYKKFFNLDGINYMNDIILHISRAKFINILKSLDHKKLSKILKTNIKTIENSMPNMGIYSLTVVGAFGFEQKIFIKVDSNLCPLYDKHMNYIRLIFLEKTIGKFTKYYTDMSVSFSE